MISHSSSIHKLKVPINLKSKSENFEAASNESICYRKNVLTLRIATILLIH